MRIPLLRKIFVFLGLNTMILLSFSWRMLTNPPYNLLHIVMAFFIWLIIFNPRKNYIYWAIYAFFIGELFYSTPFGLESFSQLIALLFITWMLLNVFTNRSFIIVFVTSLITMIFYRAIFVGLISLHVALNNLSPIDLSYITKTYFTEALITSLTLSIVYLISSIFIKHLHPEYIDRQNNFI